MTDDWEYSDYYCPKCGESLMQRDCESCGGEGITDDLFEEDPLWYDRGTYEKCDHCNGDGGFVWCGNKDCDVTYIEIKKHIEQEIKNDRDQTSHFV